MKSAFSYGFASKSYSNVLDTKISAMSSQLLRSGEVERQKWSPQASRKASPSTWQRSGGVSHGSGGWSKAWLDFPMEKPWKVADTADTLWWTNIAMENHHF